MQGTQPAEPAGIAPVHLRAGAAPVHLRAGAAPVHLRAGAAPVHLRAGAARRPVSAAGRAADGAGPGRPSLTEERRLWRAGHRCVAGMDEVGRGAWAGPVSVGVAVVRPGLRARDVPRWLRDSKQLPERLRESVFDELAAWCVDWSVGHAEHWECDALGMTAAVALAGRRALDGLRAPVEALVVDGPRALVVDGPLRPAAGPRSAAFDEPAAGPVAPAEPVVPGGPAEPAVVAEPAVAVVPVVGGDARCVSVAAASVLAKVTRDRRMREESPHFPPYDLERNKGYPSPVHRMALAGYGLTSIHRRSWAYVENLPWANRGAPAGTGPARGGRPSAAG